MEVWRELLIPVGGYTLYDFGHLLALVVALLISRRLFRSTQQAASKEIYGPLCWVRLNLPFLGFWVVAVVGYAVLRLAGVDSPVFRLFAILGFVWLLIGLASSLIRERFWAQSLAAVFYIGSCYCVLAVASHAIHYLDGYRFHIGRINLSLWNVIAGVITIVFTLWISFALSRLLEVQIRKNRKLSPSLKVLISKISKIVLIVVACMVAMDSMGLDLSAFTILSGGLGLGIGFGLQKVVSNLISGIILLVDNSVKPGDVIQIDNTYGWINNLRARYASVITRDGTEHLIPNEDLITQKVINWSFTDNLVRLKVPVGVSYNANPHDCIRIIRDAAADVPRVLSDPAPVCLLRGFGDSSVDLELRFWISDPSSGVSNVKSLVLLNVWDALKANNVEIPFPQRDLHLRTSEIDIVPKQFPDPEIPTKNPETD
ncbi:mechanosensitive ion channel family protein [Coraliomargarita akajimensis]|uniref:MscS Mechanosensitive ion channel n=1 Tax=Coraliomargarita akajimensis (strain DSM 45221 / IAM 15411 / JCM 23193 / KCTC 12865 / 04OKA010-24) TaxID=583355 RepID=D5ER45_CORAD|nr:mechanosensitive ion channel domain-containing protein [Coraliomargarita akajimensis]ADE55889.1 MscS Mechanosensitive ion channel [Coraliomargarita akajimensis DSM 45221]